LAMRYDKLALMPRRSRPKSSHHVADSVRRHALVLGL
jgi:hypothetical protein